MIFKNSMSFKAKIKQISKLKGITTQQVQQNYLIEAFLSKLAKSEYKQNFIVKGGYLIGGIVGLNLRATMDLDTTIKGFTLTHGKLLEIANEIVKIPTEESFEFSVEGVEDIREMDDYPGLKLKLFASFERIQEVVAIDVTMGDVITPKEVDFNFRKIFDDEIIELLTYPIETILAEKIETILSRGIGTTRPRDFYDVYILSKLDSERIDFAVLKQALSNTMKKRQSEFQMSDYKLVLQEIRENEFQQSLWKKYQKQYSYANNTTFDEVIDAVEVLMKKAR
ncbi:nucleotidyl transferase AbiEii/AbiGii toxin family protein [Bavariicoccus seileri]|uniref:nucleotidyl transferase AbiEii/AbiGii toxin family protein n=1 Tax=Bavariicoccus seileri TaxID=549685 RepID=UPI0003B5A155|nr:nucleotidyl transferase AbiEii/AbiGii toxin family protein [Bavariicoccus seileri]